MNKTMIALKTAIIFIIIFFGILFFAKSSLAAIYYVSSVIGSDSNPGTQTQPWARAPGMNGWSGSKTLQAGDIVYFRSQDTWTFSGGGSGWLLYGNAGVTYDGSAWGTGTKATFRATGNINDEAMIVVYQSNVTIRGFNIDGNNYDGSGVWINYNSSRNVDNITVDNVIAHDFNFGTWHGHGIGITAHNGYTTSNVTVTNCKVYNNEIGIFLYPGWDNANNHVQNVTIRGCESYNNGKIGENRSGIMIKDHITNATIEYNYIHDNSWNGFELTTNEDGNAMPQWTNINIRYNIISNNKNWGFYLQNYRGLTEPVSANIYGNLIFGNGKSGGSSSFQGGGIWFLPNNWSSGTFNFYNNTIISTNNPWSERYAVSIKVTGTPTINFKNNIVYSDDHIAIYDPGNKLTHGNNLVYRTSGTTATHVTSGSTNYNRSGVKTWESTAQNTDPNFKNISSLPTGITGTYGSSMEPNTDGLSLQSSSLGINNGSTLASPYNGAINLSGKGLTRSGSFDIGAYEYVSGSPLPDTTPPAAPANVRVS